MRKLVTVRKIDSIVPIKDADAIEQREYKNNTSGVTGVSITKDGKYLARISYKGVGICLGSFSTLGEAAKVRQEAEINYYGKLKHPNKYLEKEE